MVLNVEIKIVIWEDILVQMEGVNIKKIAKNLVN